MAPVIRTVLITVSIPLITVAGITTVGPPLSPPANAETPTTLVPPELSGKFGPDTATFPPGTSKNGIENGTRLVEAHQATLRTTSYRERSVWEDLVTVYTNGTPRDPTVRQYTISVRDGTNGTEVRIADGNESFSYWFTQEATMVELYQETGEPEILYEYIRGDDEFDGRLRYLPEFGSSTLDQYLRDLDYEFVGTVPVDNRTLYVYSSTGINETVQPNIGDTPVVATTETIDATVVVSEQGIIRGFAAQETHAVDNERVTIAHQYWVGGINETVTTTPSWVTNGVAQYNASLTANGSVVALTHLGGPSVSDPAIFLETPTDYGQTLYDGTISPGETIYLSLVKNESNRTYLTVTDERPELNRSFVSLGSGELSVKSLRYIFGLPDPSNTIQITIRERSDQSR